MSQQFNKRLYSVSEYYQIIRRGLKTIKYMIRGRRSGDLNKNFITRIMLAVTEVNGCEMCSYYHTSQALKNGMSEEDISSLLTGKLNNVPTNESVAIFFAQHYAQLKGKPTRSAWNRLKSTYGNEKAYAILAATRVIMFGNVSGIALGAFKNRLLGKPVSKSNLGYELAIILSTLVFIPGALLHNLGESLLKKVKKLKTFKK